MAWHQHPDSGKGFWSLTRYDDVAAATGDWETFSSAHGIQVMTDPEDMHRLGAIRSMISIDRSDTRSCGRWSTAGSRRG